jgi:hypothetical protein
MDKIEYKVDSYDPVHGGYPVYLDKPSRKLGYFICEQDAEYIAKHMTKMLWKHDTTDTSQY